MRTKPVIRVILFLGAVLTVVSVYLFLYFYPAVKTMNRIKRESTDFQMKIGEMRKRLSFIRLPDEKEKERVAFQDRRLFSELKRTDPVPAPDFRQDKTEHHLEELAIRTGIGRLDVTRRTPSDRLAGINVRSFAVPGLSSRSLSLAFSARLKPASAFLASIPAASANLIVDHLEILESNPEPIFLVIVKVAFLGPPEVPAGRNETEIDIDSTLPLGRITEIPDEEIAAPDLSGEWSRMSFVAPPPGSAGEKK
jgi:hypothetical protein